MTQGDFWNLAGRAGRWGKEFQGHIVCVDAGVPSVWPDPPRKRQLQEIKRAADPSFRHASELLDYIRAGAPAPRARETPLLEAVFGFVSARLITAGTLSGLPALDNDDAQRLEAAVTEALAGVDLPQSLILRHAGISPIAMGRLLVYFRSVADWNGLLLPDAGDWEAADVYTTALGVCHDVLGAKFGNEKRQFAVALLITAWMRGRPLAVIIQSRLTWVRQNKPQFSLAGEIRGVMRDVETEARFRAPKYLGCYLDILRYHLESIGEPEAAAQLPDMSMMLELGVARATEVSLISLGLSRTSAVALAEFITADALTRAEALEWLASRDLDAYPLPELVRVEVSRVLDSQHHTP
jgi:hypothetical protein